METFSQELIEPGGRGAGAVPEPVELMPLRPRKVGSGVIENGIRCTSASKGFDDQWFDYCLIDGLDIAMKDQRLRYPTYVETPQLGCIQLHRLKEGQNLAHLLVLYACFGAEGVIFVNTKDDYKLRPDLMSTLAVIKGSYQNYCCVLVSRTDGEQLMRIINQFPIVFCEINTGSCSADEFVLADDYYSKAHTRRGSVPVGHNGAQLHDKNLLLIINDRIKDDRAVSRDDFWNVMMACNKIESTWKWDRSLHNMDLLLERLLRPARFGKLFQNDFLFYVALAYRICANINGDSYDCDKRLLRIFRIVCIEALCETQPCTIVESLKSFTERGAFEITVDEKVVNIFDFLGYGFLKLCKLWVKDMKKESKLPPKYWDIAMLCMSFSQKLYTTSVSHDTASLWKEHIERHSSKITLEHDDFYHLCKGLNYMPLLGVSSSKAFTPTHFADFICSGPVRKFTFMNKLVILFCDFNIDFWERHLRYFLVRTRSDYDKFLRSRQLSYAALSKLDGMFGAFQEGWIFMFQVLDISKKRNCYDSLKEECFDWSSTVLSIINFNNLDAVPCIGLIVASLSNTPSCYAAHVTKQLDDRLFQCCQKLSIEKFQPVFSEAMFWKPRILESYLSSYTPQPDIIICNDMWQKLLQAASDSPLGNSKTVLKLMQKIGKQYQISKRPRDFILHLMRLETPNLFQCPAKPHTECYTDEFVSFLRNCISVWSLKEGLIKNYCYILECTRCEMNQFMMLIVSAVLEEVFTEMTADVLEVLHSEIIPQLHQMLGGLLQSGEYTTVRGICIIGTLKRVSVRINPSDDSLNWLNDYSQLTLELCKCFNVICKSISHKREKKELDVDIDNFLENKSGDFRDFVKFCQHLQIILLSWKEKVITQNVLQNDIRQLKELWKWFNCICEVAIVPNACIDEEDVEQLADTYEDIKSHFGELLIQRIPKEVSNEWCYLSEVLLRLKVPMPADIEAELQKYIVFPDRTQSTASAQFDVTINLNAKLARIPVARSLLSKLLTFIQPLTENLKIIVFFHLKESKHFFMYLHHFIEKVKHAQAGYRRDEIAYAADAIKCTLRLLHDIFFGSATFNGVTLNGAVDLSNTNQVDYELQLLADFATSDLSHDLLHASADLDGMYGLRCFVELDAINKYISTINEVLKKFKLHKCLASDEHKLLKVTADAMKRKGKMTLKYASDKLAKLKSALHLKSQSDLTRLRLFEPVERCTPFYQFAEQSNFTGPKGRELFIAQYRIVAPQVQHEEYNQAILHHLHGAYTYIALFFDKEVSFQDLMSAVMQMPDIDKGIENLKIVSEKFSLIKLWFSNVEGETTENIERDLKFILQSGECVFFTKEDESTVRFHLEYNRTSNTCRRKSDSEPQDFSASDPKSCDGYVQWTLEEMNEFAMKLSFLQCEKHNSQFVDFQFYQEFFNNSAKLLHSYQDLKALGHPDYQRLHEKFSSAKTEVVNIQMKVEEAQNELCRWTSETETFRQKHKVLAFFSNEKVMRILKHLQGTPSPDCLVKEISFLFESDSENIRRLTQKVKKCIHPSSNTNSDRIDSQLPVRIVGKFLHDIIKDENDDEPVSLLPVLSTSPNTRMSLSLNTVSDNIGSMFTLHSVHDFTPYEMLQLVFTVFKGVPKSYQVFLCSPVTTQRQLDLFFERTMHWRGIQYLIIGVNNLSNELQEMLVQKCTDVQMRETTTLSDGTHIDFVECSQSVLRLMPSVSINEYRDSTSLNDYKIMIEELKKSGVPKQFENVYLVFGCSGDGKTHFIRKEMNAHFSNCAVFTLNESFDPLHMIDQLQRLSTRQGPKAVHLNFTFVLPAESESAHEKEQYTAFTSKISWFLINLFILGYVEDISTGISFRMSRDSDWTIYVEVPCIDVQDNLHQSLEKFTATYPVFELMGEICPVGSIQPYDVDCHVQLVCKYLKAKKEGKLDKLAQRRKKNLIPVKIATQGHSDLTDQECWKLLEEFMPDYVRKRKMTQKLFIRYMYRRCKFLEESPYLMFNEGSGISIKDDESGQLRQTDTRKLRSVLLDTMLDEVSQFCEYHDRKDVQKQQYHQLVYDFRAEGDGSFSLLSLASNRTDVTRQQEQFTQFGFELPTQMQLRQRSKLDKYVSMALGVPYNKETGHIDLLDEREYVMTLDYAVKMLTIHERRLCGVPVVIKGESGVGKTFLLETLSALWNHALLADLDLERSRLKDELTKDFNASIDGVNDLDESQAQDIDSILQYLSENKEMSIAALQHILKEKQSHTSKYLSKLLLLRKKPVLSILSLPKGEMTTNYKTYADIFRKAESIASLPKSSEARQITVHLLYCILYGTLPETFHKISVNTALTPSDIEKLFKPILEQANSIVEESRKLCGLDVHDLTLPVVTVFLDEINTSSCLGVLKEIVIDGTLNGKIIPRNVFLVAACNPYRGDSLAFLDASEHKQISMALDKPSSSADDSWFRGSYYVRPLHPTMELLMWDYKALDRDQEREYIFAKISLIKSSSKNSDNASLTDQIVKSQELIREYAFESIMEKMHRCSGGKSITKHDKDDARLRASSTVSQRDIQRVFRFYIWLQKMFSFVMYYKGESEMKINLRAVYVALALVYYFRLDRKYREKYAQEMDKTPVLLFEKNPITFSVAIQNELDWLISNMSLPHGVVETEALKENLYAIVICTMTRTPLIIVGPPGSSKTISFKIAVNNLQGVSSFKDVFRISDVFSALEPTFYQCSRRSTSTEIDSMFKTAIKSQAFYTFSNQNHYAVVMMDEAGLPEESHESLKALHVHLDNMEVSFVAISNHVLDAAKTNRAVSLFRPETSKEDVKKLADGCLQQGHTFTDGMCDEYIKKMQIPEFCAFYGLRDFIHFCTYLQHHNVISPQTVMRALERNFNGSHLFEELGECFLNKMGSSLSQVKRRSVLDILKDSLVDHNKDLSAENEVRYKLIIDSSEDESIIRFLFTFGILKRDTTRLHICSKFPGDGESKKIYTIAAIRHSAAQGHTVILSQTDEIHESFYDLFNQRFTCINVSEKRKLYFTNIAIGPYVKPSKVDPHFQCVVVIKKSELPCTPAPFLNRFEKYALSHESLLQDVLKSYPKRLRTLLNITIEKAAEFLRVFGQAGLYGQSEFTLQSLMLTILPVYRYPGCFDDEGRSLQKIDSKTELLGCLLNVVSTRLRLSLPNVIITNLSNAAEHISSVVMRENKEFVGTITNIHTQPIGFSVVVKAINLLVDDDDDVNAAGPDTATKIVIAFLQQWLTTYLCERLMQLMTPETLIISHKKVSSHFMDVYLNHQHHFNLKSLICSFHKSLSISRDRRSVPNKLLCFSRSSPLIHSLLPTDYPQNDKLTADDLGKYTKNLERLVFSHPDGDHLEGKLTVMKLTTATTQSSIANKLKTFCTSTCIAEVMLFVVNMQHFSIEIVNHLRIMIEEEEAQVCSSTVGGPKVFVVLLHFPPEMFFNHCYPSLYLTGWDHYYLDTIAPSEGSGIDISQWFGNCCIAKHNMHERTFLEKPLTDLMKEAIPVLAARFSVRDSELLDKEQHMANKDELERILIGTKPGGTQLGDIIKKQFSSYWHTSEMAEFSIQAANFPHTYESTLSMTDAIHTMVRSSFYDYIFYILSVLKRQSVLTYFLTEQDETDQCRFKELSLNLLDNFPKPRSLSHVKISSMSEVRNVSLDGKLITKTKFPFFHFICDLLEKLFDLCKKELKTSENNSEAGEDNDEDSPFMSLRLQQESIPSPKQTLCREVVRKLNDVHKREQHNMSISMEDLKFLGFALTDIGQCCHSERWSAYFNDLMALKFKIDASRNSSSMQVLHMWFDQTDHPKLGRKIIELHGDVKLCNINSKLLQLLRFVDSLSLETSMMSFKPHERSFIQVFNQPDILCELVIDSIYDSLHKCESEPQSAFETLHKMSEHYYTLISSPAVRQMLGAVSSRGEARLQVLHTSFLVLWSEYECAEKSTLGIFNKLDVMLSEKNHKRLTLHEVVVAASQIVTSNEHECALEALLEEDTTVNNSEVQVENTIRQSEIAITEPSATSTWHVDEGVELPYSPILQYVLEGVLNSFMSSPTSGDIMLFLELANSTAMMQSFISLQHPMSLSANVFKFFLLRLLTSVKHDEADLDEHHETDDTLGSILSGKMHHMLGEFLSGHIHKDEVESLCVPIHYHLKDAVGNNEIQPLLYIYGNLMLEVLRNREMTLPDTIRLHGRTSGSMHEDQENHGESILQAVERQAITQYLIEILACSLTSKEYNVVELAEIYGDINDILADAAANGEGMRGHGLMLTFRLLQEFKSMRGFLEAMTASNGVHTDFECLRPIHESLVQQVQRSAATTCSNECFPFNMMTGTGSEEQELYSKIKKAVVNLYKAPRRPGYNEQLQKLIGQCYSAGAVTKSGKNKKDVFNMLLWLCIYYEFYRKEKSCPRFAYALEKNLSLYVVEPKFLLIILMFANAEEAVWNQQQVIDANAPKKSIGELFCTKTKGAADVELRDSLAHLVAAVLGSSIRPSHLNKHLFTPQDLVDTRVPGALVQVAVTDVLYDQATKLSQCLLPGLSQVAAMTSHTMSLQCYYFTLWANYGALCISQLLTPNIAEELQGSLFPFDFPVLQHCFQQMIDMWDKLTRYLHLTTEIRVQLANYMFGSIYHHDFKNLKIETSDQLTHYQKEWNELFVCAWKDSKRQESKDLLLPQLGSIGDSLSQLDVKCPVFASATDILLLLFSSTSLGDIGCPLYALYQFILRRPKLNAGGVLLPKLVQLYLWLHNELNHILPLVDASETTVGGVISYLEEKDPVEQNNSRLIKTVKAKYQEYRKFKSCANLPELTSNTPLKELLSTSDKHGILYGAMVLIVDSYNKFLEDISTHGEKLLRKRYLQEVSEENLTMSLVEVDVSDCCFGQALRLEDLEDILPLLSKHCSTVAFKQMESPLSKLDPTLLPCCIPQLFDLQSLQDDVIKCFVAGKHLLQMPENIRVTFQFKEDTKEQPITGMFLQSTLFQMAALEKLEYKEKLNDDLLRRTEYECHSLKYYSLLEVTIGLRNAASYLAKDVFQSSQQNMVTLSDFVKHITASGDLSELGIQPRSLTSSQSRFLLDMNLKHIYSTLKLLLEWLELGMYDFCSFPFVMKAHLREEDKEDLHNAISTGSKTGVLQELKMLQTFLVQSDSVLRNAANGKLNVSLCKVVNVTSDETSQIVTKYLTDGILVCHYVHLRLELRRLYKQIQDNSGVDLQTQNLPESEKSNDQVDDLWTRLDFEHHQQHSVHSFNKDMQPTDSDKFGFERWLDEGLDAGLLSLAIKEREMQEDGSENLEKEEIDELDQDEAPISFEAKMLESHSQEAFDEKHLLAAAKNDTPKDFADFLVSVGLEEYSEDVIENEISGDVVVEAKGGEKILKELGMSAVERLRVNFLYRRRLLHQSSELGRQCPVEKVADFFRQNKVLRERAIEIEKNGIDGEMLLQASEEAIEELGITSIGWNLIKKKLKESSHS